MLTMPYEAVVIGSENRTGFWFVHIDRKILHNWDVDSVSVRTILLAALILIVVALSPFMRVQGDQTPSTQLEKEVLELRSDMKDQQKAVAVIATSLAVMIEQQRRNEENEGRHVAFESRILWGFGGMLLFVVGVLLNHMGISVRFGGEGKT